MHSGPKLWLTRDVALFGRYFGYTCSGILNPVQLASGWREMERSPAKDGQPLISAQQSCSVRKLSPQTGLVWVLGSFAILQVAEPEFPVEGANGGGECKAPPLW